MIEFVFCGDIVLGGEYIPSAQKKGIDLLSPFQRIKYHFETDICVVNLEGPICNTESRCPDVKTPLCNHKDIIRLFEHCGEKVFNLANNHSLDYGLSGINQTTNILRENNIKYVGAGINEYEANRELIVEYKDAKIAFLAFTSSDSDVGAKIALNTEAGCASYKNQSVIIHKIKDLKEAGYIVCVILHWGREYFIYPTVDQVVMAHSLADAGANYIIGHHPHVIQGIEKYKNTLIMYSLGNLFVPPVNTASGRLVLPPKATKKYILIKSTYDKGEIRNINIYGGRMANHFNLLPYDGPALDEFKDMIDRISKPIQDSDYFKFWSEYESNREKELEREALINAFKKFARLPLRKYLATVKIEDVKRNMKRVLSIINNSR